MGTKKVIFDIRFSVRVGCALLSSHFCANSFRTKEQFRSTGHTYPASRVTSNCNNPSFGSTIQSIQAITRASEKYSNLSLPRITGAHHCSLPEASRLFVVHVDLAVVFLLIEFLHSFFFPFQWFLNSKSVPCDFTDTDCLHRLLGIRNRSLVHFHQTDTIINHQMFLQQHMGQPFIPPLLIMVCAQTTE